MGIYIIRLYQRWISPLKTMPSCRFLSYLLSVCDWRCWQYGV